MPLIPGGNRKKRRPEPSGQSFITAADFTFLGGFKTPQNYPTIQGNVAGGLTHRYRSGQFRLLTAAKGDNASGDGNAAHLLEFSVPALNSSPGSYLAPTVTTNYGKVWWAAHMNFGVKYPLGLHWDEASQQLFCFGMNDYTNEDGGPRYPISIATLNDGNPAASTIRGGFKLETTPGSQVAWKALKGACAIPSTKQGDVGGKTMLFGFGGYQSLVSQGAHMGPLMAAVSPSIFDGAANSSAVSGAEVFVQHPWSGNDEFTSPWRGTRSPDTWNGGDGTTSGANRWNPVGSVGYWNAMDDMSQSVVWIDTPTKKGVLAFGGFSGNGARANIASNTFVSSEGGGQNTFETYDIVLANSLPELVGIPELFVANTVGNYNKSQITSLSGDFLTLRVRIEVSSQQNGGSPPVPLNGGEVFSGVNYFSSAITASVGRVKMLCYDPADVIAKNTNPLPFVTCEDFVGPNRTTGWSSWHIGQGIKGVTFDPTTGLLYVLQYQDAHVGVYQLAS